MLVRKLAAVVVAAGVLLSASACSFNPSPESLQSYAPSDGSGIDFHPAVNQVVELRNFLVLTDGTNAKLYGSVVNGGDQDQSVTIQLADDATKSQTFVDPANGVFAFGYKGTDAVDHATTLPLVAKVGGLLKLNVSVDGKNWQTLEVPVLDGTIDYYKELVAGLSTAAPTATATPVVSASATATPAPTN